MGQVGSAASFDGDTEVSFGNVGSFDRGDRFTLAVWLKGRGNLPINVFQKLDAQQHRRGYEWHLDDIALIGIQKWAARLTVTLGTDSPTGGIQVRTRERLTLGDWYHVTMTYDGSGKAAGLRLYVNGALADTEVVRDALTGSIATDAPLRLGSHSPGAAFVGQIDDLRLYNRTLTPDEITDLAIHYTIRVILSGVLGKRSKDDTADVRDYFLTYAAPDALRAAYAEVKALRKEKEAFQKSIPTTMVMAEMAKPRDTFVLGRGDYRNQGDKVQPGVPAMLPPLPKDAPPNRLTLAKWLVDPGHPLTARVAVNRFWQQYFGLGIVKTQEDFGVQGEAPSHPELLDWLATELVRTNWDVRAMQRLIVTSATYRQSSRITPALLEKDPENRLLARGPRVRLPAELIRDTALAAGGLLDDRIGGPSVEPYQPPGLWEEMAFGEGFSGQHYEQSHGKDLYRRGMYTLWKRTVPPASLGDVRRTVAREVHGAPRPDEHAASGPRAPERPDVRRSRSRPRATCAARRRKGRQDPADLRLPPCNRAQAEWQGSGRLAWSARWATRRLPEGSPVCREAVRRRRIAARPKTGPRRARGVDDCRERDPEPGRDDHETVRRGCRRDQWSGIRDPENHGISKRLFRIPIPDHGFRRRSDRCLSSVNSTFTSPGGSSSA